MSGSVADYRKQARDALTVLLTKLPRSEMTKVLHNARKHLEGKSLGGGVSPAGNLAKTHKVCAAVAESLTDEAWDGLALDRAAMIEAEIESHHAVLDALNKELHELEHSGYVSTRKVVEAQFGVLLDALSKAHVIAAEREKAKQEGFEKIYGKGGLITADGGLNVGDAVTIDHINAMQSHVVKVKQDPEMLAEIAQMKAEIAKLHASKAAEIEAKLAVEEMAKHHPEYTHEQLEAMGKFMEANLLLDKLTPAGEPLYSENPAAQMFLLPKKTTKQEKAAHDAVNFAHKFGMQAGEQNLANEFGAKLQAAKNKEEFDALVAEAAQVFHGSEGFKGQHIYAVSVDEAAEFGTKLEEAMVDTEGFPGPVLGHFKVGQKFEFDMKDIPADLVEMLTGSKVAQKPPYDVITEGPGGPGWVCKIVEGLVHHMNPCACTEESVNFHISTENLPASMKPYVVGDLEF